MKACALFYTSSPATLSSQSSARLLFDMATRGPGEENGKGMEKVDGKGDDDWKR
jgi:hypothetical protein